MKINNETSSGLKGQMQQEIRQYLTELVPISEDQDFSEHKLKRRISLFENKVYPTGKFDKQGNYKYWFDIITPPVNSEVKNVDFDTKDILIYSNRETDQLACLISNLKIDEYLRTTGQAEEINSAIEQGAAWGNVLWKKVKKSYERLDPRNTYIINQTAFCVDETPVIERSNFIASDLRAKSKVWSNIDEVLENCKSNTYKTTVATQEENTTVPYYEMYERNGEVSLKSLKESKGQSVLKGDEDKYVLARVIGVGKGTESGVSISYIVYAEELKDKKMSDIYKEYHRGRYKGRWWREGLYELLFDLQVRGNAIGNQIAQGLEFASKTIFTTPDKLIMQNIITDLKNGDIIRASSFQHVPVRMEGFEQLMNNWNMIITLRNEISNSQEIVTGESQPNQPFRLGALLNQNANKLYDFLREKFSIPFSEMFEEWIIPEHVKDLKTQDVLRLTGDNKMLVRLAQMVVENWYLTNLVSFPPHTMQDAETMKAQQMQQIMSRPQILMKGVHKLFTDFVPHAIVNITGEKMNIDSDLQTIGTFVGLEMDPVRRTALIEMAMWKKGLDVGGLPKSPPQPLPQPDRTEPSREQLQKGPPSTAFKNQPVTV